LKFGTRNIAAAGLPEWKDGGGSGIMTFEHGTPMDVIESIIGQASGDLEGLNLFDV
jgi:hypothetical protein